MSPEELDDLVTRGEKVLAECADFTVFEKHLKQITDGTFMGSRVERVTAILHLFREFNVPEEKRRELMHTIARTSA
jgi:hypothetical protein